MLKIKSKLLIFIFCFEFEFEFEKSQHLICTCGPLFSQEIQEKSQKIFESLRLDPVFSQYCFLVDCDAIKSASWLQATLWAIVSIVRAGRRINFCSENWLGTERQKNPMADCRIGRAGLPASVCFYLTLNSQYAVCISHWQW